ncbi:hypothetical protein K1719_047126 [Acacia pycnantha]|nr:hypothetical protein K1719_047126 [Acacia pycnantha]
MAKLKSSSQTFFPLSTEEDDLLLRSSKKIKEGDKGKNGNGDSSDDEGERGDGPDLEDNIMSEDEKEYDDNAPPWETCPSKSKGQVSNENKKDDATRKQITREELQQETTTNAHRDRWRTVQRSHRPRKIKYAKEIQPMKQVGGSRFDILAEEGGTQKEDTDQVEVHDGKV